MRALRADGVAAARKLDDEWKRNDLLRKDQWKDEDKLAEIQLQKTMFVCFLGFV
jgi:hypothetical protein